MKQPDPYYYYLSTEIDGEEWRLEVVRQQPGNPARQALLMPQHDARTIRRILESLYSEKWTSTVDE
jgi:hypothetical protein